jgi:UDPglucose--hexose-1-phosphate uridylyltransferase
LTSHSSGSGACWEQRWHPLREEWIIVAAHRQARPWVGASQSPAPLPPSWAAECHLCPGNERVGGAINPRYEGVHIFDNDHPCVGPEAPAVDGRMLPAPYRVLRADGHARVICYGPRHDETVAMMPVARIESIVEAWQRQTHDLGGRPGVHQVLIFENKGEAVGVSNPHPHGQVYATNFTWKTFDTELDAMRRYRRETGRGLFTDIIAAEQADGRRILFEDDHVVAFVPWFARYAYEVCIAPRRCVAHIHALHAAEVQSLARAIRDVTVRFDNLWRSPFPYVMPLHQAPTDGGNYGDFHFFIGFLPPLRLPDTLKFLAGPEIGGGNFLSDTSPEEKAAELRAQTDTHYLDVAIAARSEEDSADSRTGNDTDPAGP